MKKNSILRKNASLVWLSLSIFLTGFSCFADPGSEPVSASVDAQPVAAAPITRDPDGCLATLNHEGARGESAPSHGGGTSHFFEGGGGGSSNTSFGGDSY